jgi:Beta-lactamase enzyme family
VVQSPAAAGRRGHIARRLRFHAERAPVNDPTVEEAVRLMMQLSDNAATSALIQHIGHDGILARRAALGLPHITIGLDGSRGLRPPAGDSGGPGTDPLRRSGPPPL